MTQADEHVRRARGLNAAGRHGEALTESHAAISLHPDGADAWAEAAASEIGLGRLADAVAALRQAVRMDARNAARHARLGCALIDSGAFAQAAACLEEALRIGIESPAERAGAHGSAALACARLGAADRAEAHCRAALALYPQLVTVRMTLADALAATGREEVARAELRMAYRLQNIFVEPAPRGVRTVLVLMTAGGGNIPVRDVLPRDRNTVVKWVMEYATDAQCARPPPHDIALNAIGDPDYADAAEARVTAFVEATTRPLLNDPDRVRMTSRDRLPALLSGIPDTLAPRAARLEPARTHGGDSRAALAGTGLRLPVIVRDIGSHGGETMTLARTLDHAPDIGGAAYVTELHDCRSVDGYWRKYRAIFVDGEAYPYHLAVSGSWIAHYATAGMTSDPLKRREEACFLEDPAAAIGQRAWEAVGEIGRRLGLDYAGLDFAMLPDGRVLVFEATAAMLVHLETDPVLAYKNAAVQAIVDALERLMASRCGARAQAHAAAASRSAPR